ncbi:MAG TPA: S9 family peptidase [Marinilabiliales bacterium]|nr:MAG: peptidase S9 [Bacteroidetes bacterium GWA2_40_14]OFX72698.1 MAG: peptidase S9 [Bacteroidetes bacterium GWD2_40_43]OFX91328.1 MAG: peptidase S9 [Bacteroidetes bacterium GWE2_40_63]OFY19398.1 MAG: peptidase S9 [Bacteroidetes bacterium GWF2_40_13]OFZ26050.1 MAG: peptidase S9 [Bacteroidetes bacterium RIFOXYC2_FULL_40_12]HAM97810.1 S9 family peptidase [Marinilabiliales bacterium]
MKKNPLKIGFVAFLVTFTLMGNAQQPEALPGNTSLPSSNEDLEKLAALEKGNFKYSVASYFAKPVKSEFQFSPKGQYLSYREKDENGKRHVYVKNTMNDVVTKVITESDELIRGYGWVNDNRLIYVKDQGGNENYQLFAVDVDGKNEKALTPYENVKVSILEMLKEQPDFIIIQMNKENPEVFEPYKINVNTGELQKLYENKDLNSPIMGYDFDKDGNLRALTRQVNGTEMELLYQTSPDKEFEVVEHYDWRGSFSIMGFIYEKGQEHIAYVGTNLGGDKQVIAKYDLTNKKQLEVVFENKDFDANTMRRSRKRNWEIDYYAFEGERYQIQPVSDFYKNLHQKFTKQFTGKDFWVTDYTDDEDKYLLYVTSDRLYGEYHIYDVAKDEFKLMVTLMPELNEKDMAEMRPIQFKSRDGFLVHGYITLPENAVKGEKVPLIVNPHGGPYGVRDSWGFNPETQLFASRGYATLQVNYRGSGGYGKEFYLAGSKQIGRNMLNDLEDGVNYCIEQGWADKNKIAVYGASYGGLATLGSLIKTPDLYVCGVDYVGVSNLFTFVNSFPAYWRPYMAQFYAQWYDPENPEEKKIMEEVSPALRATEITKPLFVIQGANDPRVNINESDQIVTTLRGNGKDVPYLVKYNEGHGFYHEENTLELYKYMMGFFAKYLK